MPTENIAGQLCYFRSLFDGRFEQYLDQIRGASLKGRGITIVDRREMGME